MKILLCSIGSRGDIQPFLILGDFFSKNGHDVTMASAEMYRSVASNYDVNYEAFEGDYSKLINDDEMKKAVGKNPFTMQKNLKEKVYPIIENSLHTFYKLSKEADVILYHPKTMIDSFGSDIKHKLIKTYVVPAFTPTNEFPNPLLAFLPLPKFLYKWSHKLALKMASTVKTPVNDFKQKQQLPKSPLFIETTTIYGISPSLLTRPKDYPDDHHYTGFWLQKTEGETLDSSILQFMNGEQESLIITFGSMPYKSKISINEFVKAIRDEFDLKILIVKAWGLKEVNIQTDEHIMAIDGAPFDLLFPLANYVMHHGGAGTTATAIQAGIPQFICPILHPVGDQYFWGQQLAKKGIGVPPIPLNKLTISNLLKSLRLLIESNCKAEAKKMKEQIKNEDGLKEALALVEGYFKPLRN